MLGDILREIRRRERFVLTSHARPDGDAIGSALACCQILRQMGKQAEVVLHSGVPVLYRTLPYADSVIQAPCVNTHYEAAILLECDSVQRTALEGLEQQFLISIDHHQSARPFADVNWIDPFACATGEMVYALARDAGVTITPEIATCLYAAVLTDTGSFCFNSTTEKTFALAGELVRCGANPGLIGQHIYFANPLSKMKLLGAALSNLHREGNLAWMWVGGQDMEQCEAREEDCEGLVNYALAIDGVEVALFLREMNNGRWRVSLRSKGAVDVAKIAECFGGGGHRCASGCSLPGPLSVAAERVIAQFRIRCREALQ